MRRCKENNKKYVTLFLLITLVLITVNFSVTSANNSLVCSFQEEGVVNKTRGGAFTVKITFKNTGKTEGNWSINITFEGESWSWAGTPQNLKLKAGNTKTLAWYGAVPTNATINSVARLIVYYNDSLKALNWWIHVVPGAELVITSSTVE